MPPERWQRVDVLLDATLEMSGLERAAYLKEACRGDRELQYEVEGLLAVDEEAASFLEVGARGYLDTLVGEMDVGHGARASSFLSEQRVGPYRLLAELGRGGMGVVHLAERADGGFEQRVALKVLKPGLDTDEVLRRFLLERQILARLAHPHIARLLDGGITGEGRPYVVLEHVSGLPLLAHCDARRLGIDQRLVLFETVCDAVAHAHRNLVVHRDLKPSNILVSDDGEPKLLDFGISKILAEEDGGLVTGTGIGFVTPEYASPEQLAGEPVTTATDVWGLGMVLYELLSGRRPFAAERTRGSQVPSLSFLAVPPSRAVRPAGAPAATIGRDDLELRGEIPAARGLTSKELARRLQGDLDAIVLMALRREPERRYSSAEALASDLRRHRASLSIAARHDALAYRAAKFVARHRVGALASLLVTLSLVAGLVGTIVQARKAAREARKAEQIKDLVVGLFTASDSDRRNGEDITARELLDRGAERIAELESEPEVQARMMEVIGTVYRRLGLYAAAEPHLERSLALRREIYGTPNAEVVEGIDALAALWFDKGDYEKAESLYREGLALGREALGDSHPAVTSALSDLGMVRNWRGDREAGERLLREALALHTQASGEESVEAAKDLGRLATLHYDGGDYAQAETLYRESLRIQSRLLGDRHTEVLSTLQELALVLSDMGNYEDAEAKLGHVLAVRRTIYGNEHPDIAFALANLATVLSAQGDFDGAEAANREVLAMRRKLLGEGHPEVTTSQNNLAVVLYRKEDYTGAAESFRAVLEAWRVSLGNEHPNVAIVLGNLGSALRELGRLEEAEPHLEESLELRRKVQGERHPEVAAALTNLADLRRAQGAYREAESLLREALAHRRELLGERHPYVGSNLSYLGTVLLDQGRSQEAESVFQEALPILRETYPVGHSRIADALLGLGRAVAAGGGCLAAEPHLREALRLRAELLGAEHWRTAEASHALASCLLPLGKIAEAETLLAGSLENLQRQRGPSDPLTIEVGQALAALRDDSP